MTKAKNKNFDVDNKKNESINAESKVDSIDSPDLADSVTKEDKKSSPDSKKISDLKTKYPKRLLEELRKIDYVQQYQSKFPDIKIPGYVGAWICNTPKTNWRDIFYKEGYDYLDVNEYPPVASGYSDQTGEDQFAHYAMVIPEEIYKKRQKALQEINNKRYGHILRPDKKGKQLSSSEDGMYIPAGRKVEIENKILEAPKE